MLRLYIIYMDYKFSKYSVLKMQVENMPGSYCINCRCSPKYFRNFVDRLGLSEPALKLFRSTPFGHFLDIPLVCTERPLLDALLGFWDEECQHFRFGESVVEFTSIDVT